MIITLVKADFSANNIGTLSSFAVLTNILNATYSGPATVPNGEAFTATITMHDGYVLDSINISMGGNILSNVYSINGNIITINIDAVSGVLFINMQGILNDSANVSSGTLSLIQAALSVVNGTAGTIDFNSNTKRLNSASITDANGIFVPAGGSITLTGLAPDDASALRFDCVWASSAGPNPDHANGTASTWEAVIGTDSNYVSSNYFPHNTSGENSYTVNNDEGQDCYVFFAFAGLTKNELLYKEDYNITYVVTKANDDIESDDTNYAISGTLPLVQNALSVVSGENFYQVSSSNNARMSSSSITDATGIFVPSGKTLTLTGTSGLRFDYVYATNGGPNSNNKSVNTIGGVGTASNFVSSNYFPLNADGSSDTISITNDYGADYYYFFAIAAPDKSSNILVSNYQGKITWTIA